LCVCAAIEIDINNMPGMPKYNEIRQMGERKKSFSIIGTSLAKMVIVVIVRRPISRREV